MPYCRLMLILLLMVSFVTSSAGAQNASSEPISLRFGYFNLALIKAKCQNISEITNAVRIVAVQNDLNVVTDAGAVFTGGKLVLDNGIDITTALQNQLESNSAKIFSKSAKSFSARVSSFKLSSLEKCSPELEDTTSLKTQAEEQLRRDIATGQKAIEKAREKGASQEELRVLIKQVQTELAAKQQALARLVQSSVLARTQRLVGAAAKYGQKYQLDILIDKEGIYYGTEKFTQDATDQIIAILNPGYSPNTAIASNTSSSEDYRTQLTPVSKQNNMQTASVQTLPGKPAIPTITTKPLPSTDAPIRDKWAVIIGISKFANPGYNLKYSSKDAEDFRNYLVTEAKFSADHVLTLVDEQATRANIMRAFGSKWLPNLVEPGDLVVIYISTHGTPSSADSGKRNYIVAYDTDASDLYATAVDMDELAKRIKEINSDRAVIVLDTCYSGAGIPGSRGLVRVDSFDVNKLDVGKGQMIICASSPNERSWESKNCHNGVFTRHLIDSLRAGVKVDLRSAFSKCNQEVQWEVKRDRGFPQTPQIGGNWEGSPLILSLPASQPRKMSLEKFAEFGIPHMKPVSKDSAKTPSNVTVPVRKK